MAYKLKSSVDSLCGSPAKAIDPMYNGKEGVQQADFEQFSSAAKMNAEKGTNPIYNLSGKKGLQPSNNPAAAYMTGSPAKHKIGGIFGEMKHSHNETNNKPKVRYTRNWFGRAEKIVEKIDTSNNGKGAAQVKTSKNNNHFVPDDFGEGSETQNSETSNIGVKSNDGGATSAVKTPKVKTPKKRTKINPSAKISTPKGTTVDSGIGAIKTSKITSKKSTPPSAKITKAQIKANKADNKESGMSKRQIRLEKTKLKAANARYETTSDKTKSIGGKEGQRKAAKTKRLEKRASRIEGRIKRKADKKANK